MNTNIVGSKFRAFGDNMDTYRITGIGVPLPYSKEHGYRFKPVKDTKVKGACILIKRVGGRSRAPLLSEAVSNQIGMAGGVWYVGDPSVFEREWKRVQFNATSGYRPYAGGGSPSKAVSARFDKLLMRMLDRFGIEYKLVNFPRECGGAAEGKLIKVKGRQALCYDRWGYAVLYGNGRTPDQSDLYTTIRYLMTPAQRSKHGFA